MLNEVDNDDDGEWAVLKKPIFQLSAPILGLPRWVKRVVVILLDISLCFLTIWLAYYLRLGEFVGFTRHSQWGEGATWASLASVMLAVPLFLISGLYRTIFRYSGWPALLAVARAVGIYGLLFFVIFTVIGVANVPRTVGIIQPILLLLFVGVARGLARFWLGGHYQDSLKRAATPKVLIFGAGNTGRQLAIAIAASHEMRVVGFLDNDDRLQGNVVNGQPVYNPADLRSLVSTFNISYVLLAMPSIKRKRRNEILNEIRGASVSVRTLPNLTDLATGKVGVSDLQELDIDDLLGREPVMPNRILIAKKILGKIVLVTGAGGSIGSELCRQILMVGPAKLLLVEQSEFALYNIEQELKEKISANRGATSITLLPLIASVQDEGRMREIMSSWRPDIVYHAAAYKHVPLVEHNPAAGIENNLMGTLHAAQAAIENGVSDFVLISTDKAVRPTNIMGASKRLAEMALQALADKKSDTKFSMVRFGNVLGSSGSVVPKFREQILNGGPITLTHLDVTRYFMTLPEAAQLVIQSGAMAKGGDVFVLDMGRPVKIIDLARRMVELSGLTVKDEAHSDGDIEILVTGLRSGEKLYEELLIGENPTATLHPSIMKAREQFIPWDEFEPKLHALRIALSANDIGVIRQMVQQLVDGYIPSKEILDWVHLQQKITAMDITNS